MYRHMRGGGGGMIIAGVQDRLCEKGTEVKSHTYCATCIYIYICFIYIYIYYVCVYLCLCIYIYIYSQLLGIEK